MPRKQFGALVILLVVGLWGYYSCSSWFSQSWQEAKKGGTEIRLSREATLRKVIGVIPYLPEVSWMEFDDNTVYIGFNRRPADLRSLLNAWALQGNRAIDFGVHLWAVDANKSNPAWRPGDGPYYMEVTARNGKIR